MQIVSQWQADYERISQSPVFLEHEQHVYIHKTTRERFVSVTTILSLIKNDFPEDVVEGLQRQYHNFINWLAKHKYTFKEDRDFFLRCLELYLNYKDFRPFVMSEWNGKTIKKYQPISAYKSIDEFLEEFTILESTHVIERKKNIYLTNEGEVMNTGQIKQFWLDITAAANFYGTMVHEIVEQYILLKQHFIHQNNIEQQIEEHFVELDKFLHSLDYKWSKHSFDEYFITEDVHAFKRHIINSFNALGADLGRICVPERLMFNLQRKISGMSDVFIEHDDEFFSIGDHKTNKDFTTESKFGNRLKAPFNHYEECDLVLYNLQLSIYALLYELETGKKLKNMWISYYSRKHKKFIYIKLEYLKADAEKLIDIFVNFLDGLAVKYKNNGILSHVPEIYQNHLMFLMEKQIKKHQMEKFYVGKSKEDIRAYFLDFIEKYLTTQNLIENEHSNKD